MDTFDYHRSSVPARLPAQRASSVTLQRYETGAAENVPSPVSVRAVFRATRRYWWLILALWTVGSAGLGAAVYLRIRPQYRAFSLLKVDPSAMDLYASGIREGDGPYMKTNVELIKSPNVLTAAISEEKVRELPRIRNAADPVQELTKNVMVQIRPDTQLIEVWMMSPSGEEAAILVNAVVQGFLDNNAIWSTGSRKTQIDKLTAHLDTLKTELRINSDRLRERIVPSDRGPTRKKKPGDEGDEVEKSGDVDVTADHYARLMSQYQDSKIEVLNAEGLLDQARRDADEATKESSFNTPARSSAALERRIQQDPELLELNREAQKAQGNLDKTRKIARNAGDAAAERHKEALAVLKGRIREATERKKRNLLEVDPSIGGTDPVAKVKTAESDLERLKARRDMLGNALAAYKQENIKLQGDKIEIRLLEEEHSVLKSKKDIVDRHLAQLKFEQDGDERIHRISTAQADRNPFVDKRFTYMAMAPVAVLGAVLALVVLLEIRSGRVADTEILAHRMRHEVFAIAPLPSTRHGIGFDGDKAEQRLARFVQSLDHLRVALCEGGTSGEGRCVMITSATGGEGKTTLSAHLAARCANAGTSTLLIDCDLRRASLGRLLDVPAGMGLGDVLAGTVELDGGLISVQAGGFHFLSAGTPGIDPTRVLKSTRLAELIGQLRQMYDLVIIDTPPVLPVADALIVGRWADGAVMAARYDASRLPLVERANRQIAAAGIPVLGVVVNGVKGHDQAYGNYAYNYSYPGRQEPLNNPADVS